MKRLMRSSTAMTVCVLVLAAGIVACSNWSRMQKGAVIGAASGAAVGGAVGSAKGSTAKGVLIGAAVGGTAGALIGRAMDKQAEELAMDLDGATLERVGEGILVTFDSGLLFGFDSDVVRGSAADNLSKLAGSLQRHPETDVLIVGHTDSVGSDTYNQSLSERRARAAAEYLKSRGVASSRIRTMGRGEYEPVATNETDAGRQQNRRVEVAIYASEAYRAEVVAGR